MQRRLHAASPPPSGHLDFDVMRNGKDLGAGAVPVGGGTVDGHHDRISGDLERDLWYDADGLLAGLAMTAEEGSLVTYVRK